MGGIVRDIKATGRGNPPGTRKEKSMFILRNIFGMIKVFDNLEIALEAYENECDFCEYCGLYNAVTGETIAESF